MEKVLNCVQPCLPQGKSAFLDAKFTTDEVRRAVFDMSPTKALGLDGLPAIFYQKYWSFVGEKVTAACLGVLNNRLGLEEVNETLIVMIPKIKRAECMSDFRPISLCNAVYKVVAKSLANRFRAVLDDFILETQITFIPDRLISDNAIISFECMHALKRRKKGKKWAMVIKLDISKVYDRVE
ncbi:hypothetical protein Dsin_002688 [Dipteronia sinensis]|uniref:Reverse transcriptase domain-containing protein n=1 Tax=Dipteronia sinensis TaxID=43782 RepID=A0AAE0B6K8_9ROSI|nr:hypothetical protein Dsin_002688 [Dipteronia sinensis]